MSSSAQRALGTTGIHVNPIGLGCMGFSIAYDPGTMSEADAIRVIHHAIEHGVTLFDTSDAYGPHTNEELLGRALSGRRHGVVVATKAGCAPNTESFVPKPDGRPEVLKACCDASLQRLGIDVIDLWQLHRADPSVPIEESVGAMGEMVHAGKVRSIGVSEVTLDQLQAAHATFPLAALQSELSLWTRDPQPAILDWCRDNDVAFIAFAPLGRGFLTGAIDASCTFIDGDVRAVNPRFTTDALTANQAIVDRVRTVAARIDATPAQVALAWVLAQGDHVLAIPGSDRVEFVDENAVAATLTLDADALAQLSDLPAAVGSRY